jgi:hypothetical protein
MDHDGEGQKPPLPAHPLNADESPSPDRGEDENLHIIPGSHRLVQVRRTGRKPFGKARKETFLEWFAATCNTRLSAAKAEINEKTVWRHRMKDAAFADAFDRALEQGYARLEARTVQHFEEALEVRGDLIGPEVDAAFNPQLALQLLREHARRLEKAGGRHKSAGGPVPRVASNKEIAEALAKWLKGFALRVAREKGESGDP